MYGENGIVLRKARDIFAHFQLLVLMECDEEKAHLHCQERSQRLIWYAGICEHGARELDHGSGSSSIHGPYCLW
jgi:hypothetical protein